MNLFVAAAGLFSIALLTMLAVVIGLSPKVRMLIFALTLTSKAPMDLIADISDQVGALPGEAFKDRNDSLKQKSDIEGQWDKIIHQIENGDDEKAVDRLTRLFRTSVRKYLTAQYRRTIINQVNRCIRLLKFASKTIVKTKNGRVSGLKINKCKAWMGIPYARPPIGELRWKAPQDVLSWEGVRCSTARFSPCVQPVVSKEWTVKSELTGSEDCLYLNIFRPMTDEINLPVYFWIHGGENTKGSAQEFVAASTLARKSNMIVIVIQYRLGPFGWFVHPSLNPHGTNEDESGNYGNLDMIKALHWVRNNIASFGGNPDNVTVAGESAGGFNTLNLMVSPKAKGLFHRAIVESAGGLNISVAEGIGRVNQAIEKLLVMDGTCKDIPDACAYRASMTDEKTRAYLKGKTAEEIERSFMNEAGSIESIPTIIDGSVIPATIASVFASGNYNHVPVIIGSNEYEMKTFLPLVLNATKTISGYQWSDTYRAIGLISPKLTLDAFMPSEGSDREIYEACGKYPSLYWKACMVDSLARELCMHQTDVYCYQFNWGGIGSAPSPINFLIGAGHACELPFFFGWPMDLWGNRSFTIFNTFGRNALQKAVMSYTASFVKSGTPKQAGGLPVWEQWSNEPNAPKSIILDAKYTKINIQMMHKEVTREDVLKEINGLPDKLRSMTQKLLWFK